MCTQVMHRLEMLTFMPCQISNCMNSLGDVVECIHSQELDIFLRNRAYAHHRNTNQAFLQQIKLLKVMF